MDNKQMTRWPAGVSYRNASRTLRSTIEVTIKSNKEKINGAAGAFTIPTGTPCRCKPNNLTDPSSLTGPIEQQERVLFCYHQIPHVLVARSNRWCVKVCLCKNSNEEVVPLRIFCRPLRLLVSLGTVDFPRWLLYRLPCWSCFLRLCVSYM
jgi:hypothetical protein